MLESYSQILERLNQVFPDIQIDFLSYTGFTRHAFQSPPKERFAIFCIEWVPGFSERFGQGSGYRIWRVQYIRVNEGNPTERWMGSPNRRGVLQVADKILQALSGAVLSDRSSPLLPDTAEALDNTNMKLCWQQDFREYLRGIGAPLLKIVGNLQSLRSTLSPISKGSTLLPYDSRTPLEPGELILAQFPDGRISSLGIVSSATPLLATLEIPLKESLPTGTQIYRSEVIATEPVASASTKRTTEYLHALRTTALSGKHEGRSVIPEITVTHLAYAPLLADQRDWFLQHFQGDQLVLEGDTLLQWSFTNLKTQNQLSPGLYELTFKAIETQHANLTRWELVSS